MIHSKHVTVLVCTTASESGAAIAICRIAGEDRRIVVNKSFAILDFDVLLEVVIPTRTKHTASELCRVIVGYELNTLTAEQRHNGIVKHMCTRINVNGIGKGTALNLANGSFFNRTNNSLSDRDRAARSYTASVLCGCIDGCATGSFGGYCTRIGIYRSYRGFAAMPTNSFGRCVGRTNCSRQSVRIALIEDKIRTAERNIFNTDRIDNRQATSADDAASILSSCSDDGSSGIFCIDQAADSVYRSNTRIVTAPRYASVCSTFGTYSSIKICRLVCDHSSRVGRNTNRFNKGVSSN